MTVEAAIYMYHGLDIDPSTGMRPKDATLYQRMKRKLPVELKSLPPPKVGRQGHVKQRRLIVYLHKLVIVEGWWRV